MTDLQRIAVGNLARHVSAEAGDNQMVYVTVYKGRGNERTASVTGGTDTNPRRYGSFCVFAFTSNDNPATIIDGLELAGYERGLGETGDHAADAAYRKIKP